MIKGLITLAFILFLLSNVSAECNETQIDINSASLEELQGITQIGPSRAQQIISLRSFESVDDLSRVSGIGNGTRLNQIKSEGLACASDEGSENEEESDEEVLENKTTVVIQETSLPEKESYYFPENATLPKISVNSQTIKTSNNEERSSNVNYAVLGLAGFCVLLGTLFAVKKLRRKNEFRE